MPSCGNQGSPQGVVISPLLANVYLHYVLDLWFEQEVQPPLQGRAFLIRYFGMQLPLAARIVHAWDRDDVLQTW